MATLMRFGPQCTALFLLVGAGWLSLNANADVVDSALSNTTDTINSTAENSSNYTDIFNSTTNTNNNATDTFNTTSDNIIPDADNIIANSSVTTDPTLPNITTTISNNSSSSFNYSTDANNNTTPSPAPNITTSTTTTEEPIKVDLPHDLENAIYRLNFTLGQDDRSQIQFPDDSMMNISDINAIVEQLKDAFSGVYGLIKAEQYVSYWYDESTPVLDPLLVTLTLLIPIDQNEADKLAHDLKEALTYDHSVFKWTNSSGTIANVLEILEDPCKAVGICPLGFRCVDTGCVHMCSSAHACSDHGQCYLSVSKEGGAKTLCECESDYYHHYSGDQCQYSRMGNGQAIAIVGCILGTLCLILLITVVAICIRRREAHASYAMSSQVYSNRSFEHPEFKGHPDR